MDVVKLMDERRRGGAVHHTLPRNQRDRQDDDRRQVRLHAKADGFSVVVAAGDTHRAGAIEQLSEHANRISVKVIAQRYGADPAAVARDGALYAKAHHVDVLLVDTAGRMQTNQNLMEEMGKIVRVVTPDLKIFIGDSLAGNDAISQAQLFNQYTGFDGAILTKADADTKGGAALSIAFTTNRPILFLERRAELQGPEEVRGRRLRRFTHRMSIQGPGCLPVRAS